MTQRPDGKFGHIIRHAIWPADSDAIEAVRTDVFVREQGLPAELEWDGRDAQCRHVLALDRSGSPIGTARLLPDGRIGRMAVLKHRRGHGVGSDLLAAIVDMALAEGHAAVYLHAQTGTAAFYARHGFIPDGGIFIEAGIAHQCMRKNLSGT